MKKLKKEIKGRLYKLCVEVYLKEQAEEIFKILSDLPSCKLKNGFKVQIGWNLFILLEDEEGFQVVVPDYTTNPFKEITKDLTIALWVYFEQASILRKFHLDGEMVSFQDKVLCEKGVLNLETLYLERRSKSEEGDSGWYIGSVENSIVEKEYEVYYTYEILKIRLEIMKILVLPIGYLVVLEKDELKAILNDKDINLLE